MHSRIDPHLLSLALGNGHGVTADTAGAPVFGRRRSDTPSVPALLQAAVDVAVESARGPMVLAVSGGCDSMVMLHAMVRWAPHMIAAVATFDHATGGAATEASALVAAEARRLGLTVVRERARGLLAPTESAWRAARWDFLRRVGRAYHAQIATAHTRDDQLETVVMRELRGSGARGLAALAASSDIVRPLLPVTRAEVQSWAQDNDVHYIDDPANFDRRHLRVRVRLDLLPALEAAHPGFAEEMLAVADRAATWRREVDQLLEESGAMKKCGSCIRVSASFFDDLDDEQRAIFLQAIFGRVGVALDAGGTRELVRFSKSRRRGARIPLAGGASAMLVRGDGESVFEFRPPARRIVPVAGAGAWKGSGMALPRRFGRWRFFSHEVSDDENLWVAGFPADADVVIRPWQSGDRLVVGEKSAQRRVARYFAEAGIAAPDRLDWPVVLIDQELVWVPGVCRSRAVPLRSGRSELIWYRCEREHG